MKTPWKFLMIAAVIAAFVGVVHERSHDVAMSSADAAPKSVGQLASTDGGVASLDGGWLSPICAGVGPGLTLKGAPLILESTDGIGFCFKTCTKTDSTADAGCKPDCTKDPIYPGPGLDGGKWQVVPVQVPIDMASDDCVMAKPINATATTINVYVDKKSPKLP